MRKRRFEKWTPEAITAAKCAAVALAEFWDVLRAIECNNGIEFDGTQKAIESLAADCDIPPKHSQLTDAMVTDTLNEMEQS